MILALAALLMASPLQDALELPTPPSTNLSMIHQIMCTMPDGKNIYSGTGNVIGKNTVLTANHIATGKDCRDITANVPLKMYKQDKRHDLALMVGKEEDEQNNYIRYTCNRPKAGNTYIAYGITSYGYNDFFTPIFRNNFMIATNQINQNPWAVEDIQSAAGMRNYIQDSAPGMSGGIITDNKTGTGYAIVNAGGGGMGMNFDLHDTALCTGEWN